MAYNRFSQRERLKSTYQPIQPTANFDLLAKSLERQQGAYDQVIEATNKLPQHLQADAQTVQQFKADQQARMDNVANIYQTKGIQAGNVARKQLMLDTKDAFSPTGRAYGIEQNYNAYNKYKEQLDKQLADGRITNETHRAALNKSVTDFGQSYGEDGVYNQFDGFETAEDIDMAMMADKFLSGWKADTIQGKKVGQLAGGQYYYIESKELVDPNDIHAAANEYLNTQPQVQAYLNQLDILQPREYTFEGIDGSPVNLNHSDYMMSNVLNALSSKYGYEKQDIKTMANWRLKQRLAHAHDKRNDGLLYGQQYNSQVANAPIGKIDLSSGMFGGANERLTDATRFHREAREKADAAYQRDIERGVSKKQAEETFKQSMAPALEVLNNAKKNRDNPAQKQGTLSYLMSPEANLRYPGIKNAITSLQRDTNESAEDFAKRATEVYNKAADASSQYNIRNRSYGTGDVGKKARANDHDRFLGAKGPGELVGMSYQVMDPSGTMVPGKPIGKLIEELGYKDTKTKTAYQQFRDNATFLGTVEDGAGQVIEGAGHIVVATPNGPYEIYANTENTLSHSLRSQIQPLREGFRNFDVNLTQPSVLQTTGNPIEVKAKYIFTENGGRERIGIARQILGRSETGEIMYGPEEEITNDELVGFENGHLRMSPKL